MKCFVYMLLCTVLWTDSVVDSVVVCSVMDSVVVCSVVGRVVVCSVVDRLE